MDDELKLKLAAALDPRAKGAKGPTDPAVTAALENDPDAVVYLRELRTIESALSHWPLRERSDSEWASHSEAIVRALERESSTAKGRARPDVEAQDPTAIPAFDDENTMESQPAMSEPNDQDPDLDSLAALTRTSLGPGAIPSIPPRSAGASITDDIDETSSGLVDIKQLAAMARQDAEARASLPPTAETPAVAPADTVSEKKTEPTKTAGASTTTTTPKRDDVMVSPTRATPAKVIESAPKKSNTGPLWALGGVALSAAAFFLFSSSRSASPTTPEMTSEPTSQAAPSTPSAASTTVTESAPPTAVAPEPSAAPPAPPAPSTAEAQPSAVPAPAAEQAPPSSATDESAAREESRARAHRTATASATPRPQAHAAAETPTPAAAPVVAQAPAPTTPAAAPARAAAPAAATGGTPSARPTSIDDLMGQVAPGANTAPAASAPAAQPDLPERLNRSAITHTLAPLNGAVRACAQGQTGTAPVNITIGNDGAVRNAVLSGQFAGTPVGQCITNTVRRAHFPQFRHPTQTVMYPFVILPPGPGAH